MEYVEGLLDIFGGFLLIVVALFVFGVLVAFPTMWLWNWLMPEIFGLTTISAFQAFGLYLLAGFLVRSTSSKSS